MSKPVASMSGKMADIGSTKGVLYILMIKLISCISN